MDDVVLTYLLYIAISVGLTVWVGRTLNRDGRVFLVDVFTGTPELAVAVLTRLRRRSMWEHHEEVPTIQ